MFTTPQSAGSGVLPATPCYSTHQTKQTLDADKQERRRFYDLLWPNGCIEIIAGANGEELAARGWLREKEKPADPDYIGLLCWTRQTGDEDKANDRAHERKFCEWPRQAALIDRTITRLLDEGFDVYVSLSAYPSKEDAKARRNPIPSRVILVEDAPECPDLPYSFTVETSPYSRHGYYQTDRENDNVLAVEMARGLAERYKADPSGVDRQQLVRVPTTRNTKRKADYHRVTLIEGGTVYTPAEIAKYALPGGLSHKESTPALCSSRVNNIDRTIGKGDEPWRDPEWRLALRSAADHYTSHVRPNTPLLNAEGIPRGLAPKPGDDITEYRFIAYRILKGDHRSKSPNGNWDASRDRYTVIGSMMGRGYDNGSIAATAERLADFGVEVKGSDAIWLDICRCVHLWEVKLAGKRKIRTLDISEQPATPAEPLLHTPRAGRGRGRTPGDKDNNLDRFIATVAALPADADGERRTKGADLATAMGVTPRSITTYLAMAEDRKLIKSRPLPRGIAINLLRVENKSSELINFYPRNNQASDGVVARNDGAETIGEHTLTSSGVVASDGAVSKPKDENPHKQSEGVLSSEQHLPEPAIVARLTPREMVEEAMDMAPRGPGRGRGKSWYAYVADYLARNYPDFRYTQRQIQTLIDNRNEKRDDDKAFSKWTDGLKTPLADMWLSDLEKLAKALGTQYASTDRKLNKRKKNKGKDQQPADTYEWMNGIYEKAWSDPNSTAPAYDPTIYEGKEGAIALPKTRNGYTNMRVLRRKIEAVQAEIMKRDAVIEQRNEDIYNAYEVKASAPQVRAASSTKDEMIEQPTIFDNVEITPVIVPTVETSTVVQLDKPRPTGLPMRAKAPLEPMHIQRRDLFREVQGLIDQEKYQAARWKACDLLPIEDIERMIATYVGMKYSKRYVLEYDPMMFDETVPF